MPQYVRRRGIRGLGDGDTQTITDPATGQQIVIPLTTTGVVVQPTSTGQTTSYYNVVGGVATPIGTPVSTFSSSAFPTWAPYALAAAAIVFFFGMMRK
jgi:hypothetical protein